MAYAVRTTLFKMKLLNALAMDSRFQRSVFSLSVLVASRSLARIWISSMAFSMVWVTGVAGVFMCSSDGSDLTVRVEGELTLF